MLAPRRDVLFTRTRVNKFRIVGGNRARDDKLRVLGHLLGAVADRDLDPGSLQQLDVGRARPIGPSDLDSPRLRDECERAHPRAADADEPEPPTLELAQARSAPPRSPLQ